VGSGPTPTWTPLAVAEGQNMGKDKGKERVYEGGEPRPWERGGVTATTVQDSYVNCRLREINDPQNLDRLVEETLDALRKHVPRLARAVRYQLSLAYAHLQKRLQTAEVTINFNAANWFSHENTSDSYAQMYERAIQNGKMVLSNKDSLNPARRRVEMDDLVTLPRTWTQTPLDVRRGKSLTPDLGRRRLVDKLSPGQLKPLRDDLGADAREQVFEATNPSFDPKTKQVFAALNYGRRPHGSSTEYGHSYLVLDDRFKKNALYFAGDNFYAGRGVKAGAQHQVSYSTLGALFLMAHPALREDLISSCLLDGTLPDIAGGQVGAYKLVEVHLFEKLEFRGNITHVYISGADHPKDADGNTLPLTPGLFNQVRENARKFAVRHGARITLPPPLPEFRPR
jgi:hypothetical protein